MKHTAFVILGLTSSLLACGAQGEAAVQSGKQRVVDSSGGTVALGIDDKTPYRPAEAGCAGGITGTIALQGTARDSLIAVAKDPKVCGDSAAVHETVSDGTSLGNVLVWVDGIDSGKPLPEVRRETLTIEHCRFEPRIMAVAAKTTINVFSRDHATHEIDFYREGGDQPIEQIRTVDEGQVVPSEKIASQPGIVEIRCKEHNFVRGYIAVFDHPYFAVTDANGAFKIDGLPAGTYTVKIWHERLAQPMTQRVIVQATGEARLDASVALR
ncbi:MAG TPA: carboxypeptidase-like regulatory domain-containing protein [Gemmatimonadaceae bacterium]|nr:carboxypeptidase-like regulatory domain-containing protein [Gemmatimonadaceae bacterium]